MAAPTRGAANRTKNIEMAARMKKLGIRRTTGRCPICYRIVALPIDRHLFGGGCS